jgi:hypothetical protein
MIANKDSYNSYNYKWILKIIFFGVTGVSVIGGAPAVKRPALALVLVMDHFLVFRVVAALVYKAGQGEHADSTSDCER